MSDAEQLPLFDLPTAQRARDEGMAQAADHAGLLWGEFAYMALKGLAVTRRELHTDDLAEACPWEPASPNAWGGIWMRALRAGLIERTGELRPSKQPAKHRHAYPCYRSLVFGKGEGA